MYERLWQNRYNGECSEGYFFEVDKQYPGKLHDLHNDLPVLPERIKVEKAKKLVAYLHDKTEYICQIRNLKLALTHGLALTDT